MPDDLSEFVRDLADVEVVGVGTLEGMSRPFAVVRLAAMQTMCAPIVGPHAD